MEVTTFQQFSSLQIQHHSGQALSPAFISHWLLHLTLICPQSSIIKLRFKMCFYIFHAYVEINPILLLFFKIIMWLYQLFQHQKMLKNVC